MNLYPNFDKGETAMLAVACTEEILYYRRLNSNRLEISKEGIKDSEIPQNDPASVAQLMYAAADKAKTELIPKYERLQRKLNDDEREYTDEEIHRLKILCQEAIPMLMRHKVVKAQMNGTVSEKHAWIGVKEVFRDLIENMTSDYNKLARRLQSMDTIPGDGLEGPTPFRIHLR